MRRGTISKAHVQQVDCCLIRPVFELVVDRIPVLVIWKFSEGLMPAEGVLQETILNTALSAFKET